MNFLKISLFLSLISDLALAQEPSEVAEIRKIYQAAKEEIKSTKNKFSASYQHRFTDEGEERERPLTKANLNAYFSDSKQEKLRLISLDWTGSIDGLGLYSEYLFNNEDLIFAYAKSWVEGGSDELRCYFKKQDLIHFKGDTSAFVEDLGESPEKSCLELKNNAKKLKNSLSSLIQNTKFYFF